MLGSSQRSLPTQHTKNTRDEKSITSAEYEPAIPAVMHLQTYALDPTATTMRTIPSLNLIHVMSYTALS
jgi:hypothetical protein